jgi:hypothetical protein
VITARASWRSQAPAPGLLGVAGAGAAGVVLAVAAPILPLGDLLGLTPAGRVLLAVSALALALTILTAPHRVGRWELLAAGLGALGGQALLLALRDPLAIAILLVLVGFAFAARPARRSFAIRARGPAFAALLIGVGWALVRTPGPDWAERAGALGLALGLVAAAGLVPYLSGVEVEEPASSSFLAWTGFFGPAVAVALPARVLSGMPAADAGIFGLTLVGAGLVNLAWGTVGAWRSASDVDAWRCSFLVDWGLALVGIGLFVRDGTAAAYLALLSIVVVRLPLYLWARPALLGSRPARLGARNVLLAVLLAGAAPFSGFPVRLLVLGAATQAAWPLAIPLVLAMLLCVACAVRLARTIGATEGREAVGLWLTLGLSLLLGVAPGALRALGGV